MTDESYEAGLRDGKLDSLKVQIDAHERQLDKITRDLENLKRICYALAAMAAMSQAPAVLQMVKP